MLELKPLELKPCPQCGKKVLIAYVYGNNFMEVYSSMNQAVEAWNKFCKAERNFYENQKNHKPVQGE